MTRQIKITGCDEPVMQRNIMIWPQCPFYSKLADGCPVCRMGKWRENPQFKDCELEDVAIEENIQIAIIDCLTAILDYEPHAEVVFDEFAYTRLRNAYRAVAYNGLSQMGITPEEVPDVDSD